VSVAAGRFGAERRGRPRDAVQQPERSSLGHVLHHGLRWVVLLAVAAGIYQLFPVARTAEVPVLERGVVVREDVIAPFDFVVPKSPEVLRREREEAARGVPPLYDHYPAAADSVVGALDTFFSSVDEAVDRARPGEETQAVQRTIQRHGIPTTLGGREVLSDPVRRTILRRATEDAVRQLFPEGVAAASPARDGVSFVHVRGVAGGDRLVPADSVMTADQFYRAAQARLPAAASVDAAELQRLLLLRFFQPSLRENPEETAAARMRHADAVDPVRERILAGQKIVGEREQVGEREEERLRALQAALQERGAAGDTLLRRAARVGGGVLFNILLLLIPGLVLWISRPAIYHDDRAVLFLGLLVLAVAAMASGIARFNIPPELIPVPFAVLVVAALWGGRLALVLALSLALLLGGQGPFVGLTVPFQAALAGAAAAFGVRVAERRLQTWGVIGIVALTYAMAVLALGLMRTRGVEEMAWSMTAGAASAVASTLLAIGFLPLAEWFTRITTNQTLMELADPKHKLLQRLSLEAPGTYAHTISVANLAEAVCNAVGANALLARVGVYYHDIGKTTKPQYFIENQPRGRNPHDRLKPAMSAAIVRSHVSEGLRLAAEHRLPDAVKAFIAEHHGTQAISFFMDQARAADPDAPLNPAEFAYQGPKPQTRETAIVMMADSVESAARVLQDPSPQRIRDLVDRIVDGKIVAGQLDECPLTLREITVAKEVLAKVLNGMYHQRLDYPPSASDHVRGGSRPLSAPDDVRRAAAGADALPEPASPAIRDA
jgi:cyclic-di-AMP phosphodiesterase PgpH